MNSGFPQEVPSIYKNNIKVDVDFVPHGNKCGLRSTCKWRSLVKEPVRPIGRTQKLAPESKIPPLMTSAVKGHNGIYAEVTSLNDRLLILQTKYIIHIQIHDQNNIF